MKALSELSPILDHLAWLREQLKGTVTADNAHAATLLTYNAAALLQWHFVLPSSDSDWIADSADRKRAAKLIDDFVWAVRGLHQDAKAHRASGGTGTAKAKAVLEGLATAITKVLLKLPKLARLPKPHPIRSTAMEQEVDPFQLLGSSMLAEASRRPTKPVKGKQPDKESPRRGLRGVLAGIFFVRESRAKGRRGREFADGCEEICAAFYERALGDYVQSLSGVRAERLEQLGRDVQSHLVPGPAR